ncbi:hypothetical protein F4804DRAFT_202819 [Jackrogersella minutella]|nr:hypothetical protein F4804DRAFT_202819 [Jackrogersella minutella]
MSRWSADSTVVASDTESIETRLVGKVTRDERDRHSITIVVSALPKKRLREEFKSRWSIKLRAPPPTHVSTAEDLQETIDNVKCTSKQTTLNLLVSSEVPEISFNVPSNFETLKILRCASKRDKGRLFVDGASTYHNVRLDRWEAHRHKNHALIIGYQRGVRIRLASIVPNSTWAKIVRAQDEFSSSEQEDLRMLFEKLSTNLEWGEVKGTVAAILSLVVGTYKSAMGIKTDDGGIDVRYAFGLAVATSAKMSTIATAAGPAVMLGAVSVAAVYFIPWDSLFDYLKISLSWLWDKICKLWERFKCWVQNLFTGAEAEKAEGKPQGQMVRPMKFSP